MLTKKEQLESLAKKAETSIGEFEAHLMKSLPSGLNTPLTRSERAILKTFYMWFSALQQERSTPQRSGSPDDPQV